MGIVVIGASFVDVKGFPNDAYIPTGRNVGRIEYIHGGVARNVVEDIANVELRPTYVGIVDDSPLGTSVKEKLKDHKVNTDYVLTIKDGMGTWLAVFDNNGDVAGSISKRPNLLPLVQLLEFKGEFVIVVEGTPKVQEEVTETIEELMERYLDEGMDKKEAMKLVAKEKGVSKSEVYKVMLEK